MSHFKCEKYLLEEIYFNIMKLTYYYFIMKIIYDKKFEKTIFYLHYSNCYFLIIINIHYQQRFQDFFITVKQNLEYFTPVMIITINNYYSLPLLTMLKIELCFIIVIVNFYSIYNFCSFQNFKYQYFSHYSHTNSSSLDDIF